MNENLVSYYHERAKEYEKVYLNPDEQADLRAAEKIFQDLFADKTVLELACGTGYWTERIAKTASSILATDINESVLEIARERQPENVVFAVADMFDLAVTKKFNAVFGGFIFSHILLQDLNRFLGRVRSFLQPDGTIVFVDCKAVDGTKHDPRNITKTDDCGNTFQTRKLENGTSHLVLKNFPTKEFLSQKLLSIAGQIRFIDLEFYWIVVCKAK